jgi:hypothetical protein
MAASFSVAIWFVAAVLAITGPMAGLLSGVVICRLLVRVVRRLVIWLDEEERVRLALSRHRLLHSYNEARDEVKEIKAKIEVEQEVEVIKVHGHTLKHKTEILQRRERALLDAMEDKN